MRINWDRVSWWAMCFITIISISLSIVVSQKRNYWKKETEISRLDARTWELRYQDCCQRNQKLEDHLFKIITTNYEK